MDEVDLRGSHSAMLASGLGPVQRAVAEAERAATRQRGLMFLTVPGLLQSPGYIRAVLAEVTDTYGGPGDLDEGVAQRLARQKVLNEPGHTFHYLLMESVLWQLVGGHVAMAGQLARLGEVARGQVGSMKLGMIRHGRVWGEDGGCVNMAHQFVIYDDREVWLELPHTHLIVDEGADIARYVKVFECAARQAVYGATAAAIIDEVAGKTRRTRL